MMFPSLVLRSNHSNGRGGSVPSILASSPATTTTTTTTIPELPKAVVFATSGLGGMLGWAIVHPFNTIAVRANLASASGQTFSLTQMVANQGWMSVYDGLSAGVMRQVFYATARFGLFETFRDMLHEYRGKTDFASRYVYLFCWIWNFWNGPYMWGFVGLFYLIFSLLSRFCFFTTHFDFRV